MEKGRFHVPAGVTDAALAVGVAALLLGTGLSGQHPDGARAWFGGALLAAGGLALAAHRRAPRAVLAVTGPCALGYQVAGFQALAVAYLVAVYGAVRAGHRVLAVAASAALTAALHVASLTLGDGSVAESLARARQVLELAWLIAAFAAGEAVRQAEQRAEAAERTREEAARHRADEERLRIARELHDALTHQISVVTVQADVAVHVARRRGERVPQALLAIQQAGREASRELRATLETLRDDDTAPPRGLDDVPDLVARFDTTGLRTTLTIEGRRAEVPTAVGRTAYRIVQEALTNVARHAAAGTVSVHVDCRPDAVTVRVDDDGRGAPGGGPTPGLGLLGMRERVNALGGSLRAEPRATGGFTVRAELPTTTAS